MTFTATELRQMAISDNRHRDTPAHRGRPTPHPDGLGVLTFDRALAMHQHGASLQELADAAGCCRATVGIWRRTHRLVRAWVRRA